MPHQCDCTGHRTPEWAGQQRNVGVTWITKPLHFKPLYWMRWINPRNISTYAWTGSSSSGQQWSCSVVMDVCGSGQRVFVTVFRFGADYLTPALLSNVTSEHWALRSALRSVFNLHSHVWRWFAKFCRWFIQDHQQYLASAEDSVLGCSLKSHIPKDFSTKTLMFMKQDMQHHFCKAICSVSNCHRLVPRS